MKTPREIPICEFCNNTGVHLCPDVAKPILIRCTHKNCFITRYQEIEDLVIDLKQNGVRFELHPTQPMLDWKKVSQFFLNYIERINNSIKERAMNALSFSEFKEADEEVFSSNTGAPKSFAEHIDADPNCKKCKGTGSYMYDHNHGTICNLCCKHKSGYWLLPEGYAHSGEWCCLDGCGTTFKDVADDLKRYRGKDF